MKQMPYTRAIVTSVAFWLQQGVDELDNGGRHFTCPNDDCFDPGNVMCHALALRHEDPIDQCYALTWGIEIGAAMATEIQKDPFGDHSAAAAAIVRHHRALIEEQRQLELNERAKFPDHPLTKIDQMRRDYFQSLNDAA